MNALILTVLVVVGVGVVVVARTVSHRVEAWADAMILSFGLFQAEERDGLDNLASREDVSGPLDQQLARPQGQVRIAEPGVCEDAEQMRAC